MWIIAVGDGGDVALAEADRRMGRGIRVVG